MTPVTVREARPEDAVAISRVAAASWRDTYRDIFEPDFIDDFLAQNYAPGSLAAAAERAATRQDAHFLVAERDGEIVAYAHFGVGEHGPQLWRIYAHPDHYGTGAGSALLDELEGRIDVDSYRLDVHSRNRRGRAFYDRRGFVVIGGGETVDCDLTLRRTLRPARPDLPLETDRLRIRSLTEADLNGMHAIYGDAQTMRFIGGSGRPTEGPEGTARILAWLRRHEALHGFSAWALDERDGEPMIGVAGLLWVEGHGPEVEAVYLLRRDRWGQGHATEATRAVLDLAHGPLGLRRVIALAYPENVASLRVMEKTGMRPDGETVAYGRRMVRAVSER